MYRQNASPKRQALRAKYRKKHGNDWWQDDKIKARFDKELKGKSRVKPLKGKALERAMTAVSERTKYLNFTEDVERKIKKKLGPLIKGRQGISDMDIGSTEEGDYMVMMLGKRDLQLVISKPRSWMVLVENTATGDHLANSVPSKQGTATRLANEAVKVYKSYMKSYGDKKSSSRKSSSKSLNILKGAGLKRLAQAIETFIPIIKGNVKVMMAHKDGAHLILGTSKYNLIFENKPRKRLSLDVIAPNEDYIEFIGMKSSASLKSMREMVYDVLNTAHDFDGGKLLKKGFAGKSLNQL